MYYYLFYILMTFINYPSAYFYNSSKDVSTKVLN